MKSLSDCQLYTFVDTAYLHGRPVEWVAQKLCDGGSDIIQLRAKNSSPEEVRKMAEAILPITRKAGVGLVISRHPTIANEIGAEFCHLGQEDFFDAGHTHVSELKIKNSKCQNWAQHPCAGDRQKSGAVVAGILYCNRTESMPTGHKTNGKARDVGICALGGEACGDPWFAIGGINLENLNEVLTAGARRICVVSAILNAPDIAEASQRFKARFN